MTNLEMNREQRVKNILAKCTLIAKFAQLENASFVGIRDYLNKHDEISNQVVDANFSYGNAVEKDLKALKSATESDINNIIFNTTFTAELVKTAIAKLINGFEKNQNSETKSNQSKAQTDTYLQITNGIKLHKETGQLYIYALLVDKHITRKGHYDEVKSNELTLAQNAVKKYFDLSTAKFRSFIVDENHLTAVRITGDTITLIV